MIAVRRPVLSACQCGTRRKDTVDPNYALAGDTIQTQGTVVIACEIGDLWSSRVVGCNRCQKAPAAAAESPQLSSSDHRQLHTRYVVEGASWLRNGTCRIICV